MCFATCLRRMTFVFLLGLVLGSGSLAAEEELVVMFWNLENFFDPRDGGKGSADEEFSSRGKRHWTWERFDRKKNKIAKTILCVGQEYGHLPDIVGVAEVENAFVLWSLCNAPPLKKADYGFVHFESPDHRGIDVGLLYRKSEWDLLYKRQVPLMQEGDTLHTRAILEVELRHRSGQEFVFLVNHHPSKFSGAKASAGARFLAMEVLRDLCQASGDRAVAMGDFNDVPDAPQLAVMDGTMANLGDDFIGTDRGSIRFDGKWQLIDFFLVPEEWRGRCTMEVFAPEHLLEWDGRHTGVKPFRTYSGPRYKGGVSDHLPVILHFSTADFI